MFVKYLCGFLEKEVINLVSEKEDSLYLNLSINFTSF